MLLVERQSSSLRANCVRHPLELDGCFTLVGFEDWSLRDDRRLRLLPWAAATFGVLGLGIGNAGRHTAGQPALAKLHP